MKKKLLSLSLLALLCLGFAGKSAAQGRFVAKINPLSLFAITGNISGEYAFNEKMSAQLGFFIGSVNLGVGADGVDGGVSYTWFGITPEFRYYASNARKPAPAGLYFAPFVRYRQVTAKFAASAFDPDTNQNFDADATAKIGAIGGGVLLGYQFLFGDVFALDMFLGPQYSQASTKVTYNCEGGGCDGDEVVDYSGLSFGGVGVRAGIAIGIAF